MVTNRLDKLRELILYIAMRYQDDDRFGVTRLTKVLFWADFEHFRETGESITGSNYIKMPRGPMLEGQQGILQGMQWRQELRIELHPSGGSKPYQRPVASRQPDLSLFTASEIQRLDRIIEEHRGETASKVSDLSHKFLGWQVAHSGERIPPGTASVYAPEITEEDIQVAMQLGPRLGSA